MHRESFHTSAANLVLYQWGEPHILGAGVPISDQVSVDLAYAEIAVLEASGNSSPEKRFEILRRYGFYQSLESVVDPVLEKIFAGRDDRLTAMSVEFKAQLNKIILSLLKLDAKPYMRGHFFKRMLTRDLSLGKKDVRLGLDELVRFQLINSYLPEPILNLNGKQMPQLPPLWSYFGQTERGKMVDFCFDMEALDDIKSMFPELTESENPVVILAQIDGVSLAHPLYPGCAADHSWHPAFFEAQKQLKPKTWLQLEIRSIGERPNLQQLVLSLKTDLVGALPLENSVSKPNLTCSMQQAKTIFACSFTPVPEDDSDWRSRGTLLDTIPGGLNIGSSQTGEDELFIYTPKGMSHAVTIEDSSLASWAQDLQSLAKDIAPIIRFPDLVQNSVKELASKRSVQAAIALVETAFRLIREVAAYGYPLNKNSNWQLLRELITQVFLFWPFLEINQEMVNIILTDFQAAQAYSEFYPMHIVREDLFSPKQLLDFFGLRQIYESLLVKRQNYIKETQASIADDRQAYGTQFCQVQK